MKKSISFLLCICILISILPFTAVYAEENGVIFTPTASNCDTFSGWDGKTSLKRYNGTSAGIGGGTALFTVPESVDGWTDIYYYVSSYEKGYTSKIDFSVTMTIADAKEKEATITYLLQEGNGGYWVKVAKAEFSSDVKETINITDGRLTDVKFVPSSGKDYILTSEHFNTSIDWSVGFEEQAYNGKCLRSYDATGDPATVNGTKIEPGDYYVFVNSADFKYSTGTRNFTLTINGTEYKKNENQYFGTHLVGTEDENSIKTAGNAVPVFAWEQMTYPADKITVGEDGVLNLEVNAISPYVRLNAIVLTQDPNFSTNLSVENATLFCEDFPLRIPYEDKIPFPESGKGDLSNVSDTAVLENEHTSVSFRKGISKTGREVVQREILVGDTVVSPFENGFGFLSMYAAEVKKYQSGGYYGSFDVLAPMENGDIKRVGTTNVFRAGAPEWLIASTLEQVNNSTVRMTADGQYMSLVATWTLDEDDLEPKVTVTFTAKRDGEYSLGLFNEVNEVDKEKVGYILNPYRWQESRYPAEGETITETNSTTDHTQMTYKMNDKGQEISVGVAVDQSSIDLTVPVKGAEYEASRWPHDGLSYSVKSTWAEDSYFNMETLKTEYKEITLDYTEQNADFVMNTTGFNGGVQPAIFAPKMASVDSAFQAGETYTIAYRPLSTVSSRGENQGWYDLYSHIASDIRGVYDYRDNYFSSMTDASFNLLNFLMDDELSGWSDEMIGHYNIEDSYWATNSNGLAYLQNYLLTEDANVLNERTLQSMGSMLTRSGPHVHRRYSIRGESETGLNKEIEFTSASFGNATYAGAYLMSQGMMPIYRDIAAYRNMTTTVETGGMDLQNTTDLYWFEWANGENDYTQTLNNAEAYHNRAFASASNDVSVKSFINISYTPQFQAQFDAYEITGNEKYLAGAVESARRFLPSLRITDMPESKSDMRVEDTENLLISNKVNRDYIWSYDGRSYRRGALLKPRGNGIDETSGSVYDHYTVVGYLDDAITFKDTTGVYPAWVTARTGLGVEQLSTCTEGKNILMSTWAGDLLRLGYLSDDQLMMDLARSSIVGRFANYPGYYYTEYTQLPSLAEYPIRGYDVTSLYFHHAPVFLAAVQDYLFSNAYVKSDGNVNFPNTRIQGYACFNNRMYGHESGNIYRENDMWPWLKEGTITVYDKQIDWIGGRKEGRAAFVFTNAGDQVVSDTVVFNADLGIADGAIATVYDKEGNITEAVVSDNKLAIEIPAKGILTVAVNAENVHAPAYTTVEFDETQETNLGESVLGLMYEGRTYEPSYKLNDDGTYKSGSYSYNVNKGYDVKAYALAFEPETYMGYIFVGGRSTEIYNFSNNESADRFRGGDGENGIVKTTLTWHFEGEDEEHTVVDNVFPYEFWIPVNDRNKKIVFTVETEFKNETRKLGQAYTIAPVPIQTEAISDKTNFEPVSAKPFIKTLQNTDDTLLSGNIMMGFDNRTSEAFGGMNVLKDDALEGCYLNGYLEVKDIPVSENITESGYLLFDNVKIEQSKNSAQDGEVQFSLADPYTGITDEDIDNWAVYDKDGNYLGIKQNVLNVSNQTVPYVWDNLYITNAKNDNTIQVTQNGNVYTVSCNGAKYCKVLIATYDVSGKMVSVDAENVIVSINNSKEITVQDNQKVFVWSNAMYQTSTFRPLLPALTK